MKNLTGKTVFITGGSRGIGAAIARKLAAMGAFVAFSYHNSEHAANALVAEIEHAGGNALAIKADNTDHRALQGAIQQLGASRKNIDILINNAGIFDARPVESFSVEDLDSTLNVNVRAVFIASQAVLKHMPNGGRIINIGSNLATRVPGPGLSLYAMSKAALVGLTKAMARELGHRRINVNIVHPGSTDTDMNPANGEHAGGQLALMAIPKFNSAMDVANVVSWLAEEAGQALTGTEITVDHGANI
ncbi:3-oxoacyl-ACP reductase FabG [Bowmanella denitrificans]|uniref:3-oxoacyl-ACP reductase FabG n=1 Tax=Bowmanella denitrificans TaxID=366582 RepID=A0ABP3HP24_9ALTE